METRTPEHETKTPVQNIADVFRYHNMPDQTASVNGAGHHLSYLGYILNQFSLAKAMYSKGNPALAENTLDELKIHYSILESQLSLFPDEDKNTILRTLTGEPVDVPTLMGCTIRWLKADISMLEEALREKYGNINKSTPQNTGGGNGNSKIAYV